MMAPAVAVTMNLEKSFLGLPPPLYTDLPNHLLLPSIVYILISMTDGASTPGLLCFTAPLEEATFYSLPYVEELLLLSNTGHAPAVRLPFSEQTSAIVKERLEEERIQEEVFYFNATHHQYGPRQCPVDVLDGTLNGSGMNESATTKPGKNKDDTVTCEVVPLDHTDSVFPKYLLQTGLARALGLQVPPLKTVEETVLGRVIDRGTGLYREERADRLCQTVVVEWFEDILLFIQRSGFNVVQTRCILLDALGVLRSLQELPPEAITSDAEMAVSHVLEDALVSQTCVLPTSVLERQVLLEEVRRTVPDPVILEGLQKRLREEKLNKKQQQALQAEMEQVPQVEVVSKEERVREVPTDVKIGPYFTLSEAACVLSYLCESALMHWRLWSCVLQPTAEVHPSPEPQRMVLVEDVPSFTMPPLAEFLPEDKHNFQVSRTLLLREAEDSLNRLYNEFESKWNDLKTECEEDHTRVKEILDIADEHNRHNALNPTEYDSVERAFTLRLNALMTKNASVGPLAAAMRPEQEEPAEEPVADQKGSKKKKSTPGKSAPVQLPDPDTIVLPDDAAFEVEEVERRVHRVEETYLEQSESKKKKR